MQKLRLIDETTSMSNWWDRKKAMRADRSVGYDPKRVDEFLAHIGAGHAAGVEPGVLRLAIEEARFPVMRRGYDRDAVEAQLADIATQLTNGELRVAA